MWLLALVVSGAGIAVVVDDSSIDEYTKNSLDVPLVLMFYAKHCSRCDGIHEAFKVFSRRGDIHVGLVNCGEKYEFCQKFGVTIVPRVTLVIGQNRRYWRSTDIVADLSGFIDGYLMANTFNVDSNDGKPKNDMISTAVAGATSRGGSTFVLTVPELRDEMLVRFRQISQKSKRFGTNFAYSLTPSQSNPNLSVFYGSVACQIFKRDDESLDNFVERFQFGPLHKYDLKEWSEKRRNISTLILVVEDDLLEIEQQALINLAEKYCSKLAVGWISVREFPGVLEELGKQKTDLPFTVHSKMGQNCHTFTKSRTSSLIESSFIERAEAERECGKEYGVAKAHENTVSGSTFFGMFAGILLLMIGLVRLIPLEETKDD